MEENAFQAIYTGVYIVIFIFALTTTLYLFNGISTLAEDSYEYGNVVTGQTIIEAPSNEDYYLSDSEIISLYMNYIKKDQYESGDSNNNNVTITLNNNTSIKETDYSYSDLVELVKGKKYRLGINGVDNFQIIEK